jgi:hypothetical protein
MKLGKVGTVLSIILACGLIGTSAYTVVDTRAIAVQTAARLNNKIIQDKIDWIEFKIEELLQKWGSYERMPESTKAWFRSLQKQLRDWRAKQQRGS